MPSDFEVKSIDEWSFKVYGDKKITIRNKKTGGASDLVIHHPDAMSQYDGLSLKWAWWHGMKKSYVYPKGLLLKPKCDFPALGIHFGEDVLNCDRNHQGALSWKIKPSLVKSVMDGVKNYLLECFPDRAADIQKYCAPDLTDKKIPPQPDNRES